MLVRLQDYDHRDVYVNSDDVNTIEPLDGNHPLCFVRIRGGTCLLVRGHVDEIAKAMTSPTESK